MFLLDNIYIRSAGVRLNPATTGSELKKWIEKYPWIKNHVQDGTTKKEPGGKTGKKSKK